MNVNIQVGPMFRNPPQPNLINTNTPSNTVPEVITLVVNPTDNILSVKEQIFTTYGIQVDNQNLMMSGKQLEYDSLFSSYNIQSDTRIFLRYKFSSLKLST